MIILGISLKNLYFLSVNLWKSVLIRGLLTIALKVTKELVRRRGRRVDLSLTSFGGRGMQIFCPALLE